MAEKCLGSCATADHIYEQCEAFSEWYWLLTAYTYGCTSKGLCDGSSHCPSYMYIGVKRQGKKEPPLVNGSTESEQTPPSPAPEKAVKPVKKGIQLLPSKKSKKTPAPVSEVWWYIVYPKQYVAHAAVCNR